MYITIIKADMLLLLLLVLVLDVPLSHGLRTVRLAEEPRSLAVELGEVIEKAIIVVVIVVVSLLLLLSKCR